jgi:hypothetical protein
MQVKHERSADTLALGARAVVPSRVSVRDRGKDGAVGKLGKFLNRGALDFLPAVKCLMGAGRSVRGMSSAFPTSQS